MGNHTESLGEYLGNHLFYGFIVFLCYQNIFLHRLGDWSYSQSRSLLIAMAVGGILAGAVLHVKRNRNGKSVFANVALPFGLFTAISYWSYYRPLFAAVFLAAGICSVCLGILILGRRLPQGKRPGRIWRRRIWKTAAKTQFLLAALLTGATLWVGGGALFGFHLFQPSVEASTSLESNPHTIANHMDTLLCLQEDLWQELSLPQRLDVLQTVANIEARYLGLPYPLSVGAANLEEGTLGSYKDQTGEILVSLDSLGYDPAAVLLNTVCHEAYHSYQHCLVSVLNSVPEEEQKLRLFRDARDYAEEFGAYQTAEDGFLAYYDQECESDARDYAEDAVWDYYGKIQEYLEAAQEGEGALSS